jgi:putative hydrolases of HD superfamily
VLAALPPPLPQTGTTSPVPFFHLLERLKTTKREGWRRFGIDRGGTLPKVYPEKGNIFAEPLPPESISDHMYRMSILTMFAPPDLASRVNIPHCTKMALIHDMAESLVGDITPVDGVSRPEKNRREAATMDYLTSALLGNVHGGLVGSQIREIWEEYEKSETLEAKFVHDIDKMELLLQMIEYERAHNGALDLGEFSYVATKIILPEVRAWSEEVLREQKTYWESLGKQAKGLEALDELRHQVEEYYGNGEA